MADDIEELLHDLLLSRVPAGDTHQLYRHLRETSPVHRSTRGRVWFLSRYDDCHTALRDPQLGKGVVNLSDLIAAPDAERRPLPGYMTEGAMVFMNPPEHTRVRGLVSRAFTKQRILGLRPVIARHTARLLDRWGAADEVDIMDEFAFHLPVAVIGELVGVPETDWEQFRSLVRDGAVGLEPGASPATFRRAQSAALELTAYFSRLVRARRHEPRDDLLSALIQVSDDDGAQLSKSELICTAILLFGAGFETTMNLIGNAVLTLLRHPDELSRLRAQPALMTTAVDEILRYEGTAHLAGRLVLAPTAIAGHPLEPGEWVIALLASANRDPEAFPDPERFDIGRQPNHHLAFSTGIHHCLGASLARLELAVVLEQLLDRYAVIEGIEPPGSVVPMRPGVIVRGPERVRLRLRAA